MYVFIMNPVSFVVLRLPFVIDKRYMGSGKRSRHLIRDGRDDVFVLQSKKKKGSNSFVREGPGACLCPQRGELGHLCHHFLRGTVQVFVTCNMSFKMFLLVPTRRWRHILHVSQRRGTLTAETVRQQCVNTLQAVCSLKEQYSWSVRTSDIFVLSSVEREVKKCLHIRVHEFWSNNPVLLTREGTICHRELRLCSHVTKQVLLIYFTWQSEQFWVLGLLLEFSQAKQIQCFFVFFSYLGGHGSVICQTKCFLRLAMCTHQVSVACKSHFTKCQKNIPLQSEGRRRKCMSQRIYCETFSSFSWASTWKLHDNTNQKQAGE